LCEVLCHPFLSDWFLLPEVVSSKPVEKIFLTLKPAESRGGPSSAMKVPAACLSQLKHFTLIFNFF